ncbi:MAG TPA: hypothetical protein VNT56_10870 [Acidimicrobiales bacterium]|jgi:uncharacterized membrane protein|nr:hypothetical protein [Acidimicrobiales bacterium]
MDLLSRSGTVAPGAALVRADDQRRRHGRSALALATLLAGAGISHFAAADGFERIVPRVLGASSAAPLVVASGVAELVAAALLVRPRTRRLGAACAAGILVAVFPANVQMALDGGLAGAAFPLGSPVASWLRLPLQILLVWWALTLTRRLD